MTQPSHTVRALQDELERLRSDLRTTRMSLAGVNTERELYLAAEQRQAAQIADIAQTPRQDQLRRPYDHGHPHDADHIQDGTMKTWLVKLRPYGGGESVVSQHDSQIEAIIEADLANAAYQSDIYYVEKFDPNLQAWPTRVRNARRKANAR